MGSVEQYESSSTPIELPNVTLVSVSSVNLRRTLAALRLSMKGIKFGEVRLITHKRPRFLDQRISVDIVPRLASIDDYNRFMIYSLADFIATDHCLVVQADGYVLDPSKWDDEFLTYDYVGAPWPVRRDAYVDPYGKHHRVGNGGFSLRSRRLLSVPQRRTVEWEVNSGTFYRHMGAGLYSEDGNICVHNRHVYEEDGCRFAPVEVAGKFSIETLVPESSVVGTFGFHKRKPGTGTLMKASWSRGFPWT